MYPIPMNGNGVSRLPKTDAHPAATAGANLARTVGTVAVQAVVIIVVAKLVDALVDGFKAKRRAQQAQAPQRRREEAVA